ncbi:DUF4239 domain-containing protein [Herbidospora yilanensis]|uniref:bestrophin-like domain n=1 Tax=Herbidospora yilanensis TaxID=354426 RepID=UPI0007864071|nr:DUF4239 domain-containing protein [Herbidospora yilanensis]
MVWVFGFVAIVVVALFAVLTWLRRSGRSDEEGGAGPIDFAVNLALAVFLVVVAYAVVLCRDAISASGADVRAESESLVELYWAVAPLPQSAEVRDLVRAYTTQTVELDWPRMREASLDARTGVTLDSLRTAMLKLPTTDSELRAEALARAAEVSHARTVRADNATSGLESVFMVSMVISGLLVIALPWALRRRPTAPSVIADVVRVATVVTGIVVIHLISHPYGLDGAVDPGPLKEAQVRFDEIDRLLPSGGAA